MTEAPEAALARYADGLADAVEAALGAWVERAVARRLAYPSGAEPPPETAPPPPTPPPDLATAAAAAGRRAVADVGPRLRDLLALDIDDQWTNPLAILRSAVAYPSAVLADAGAPPVERDAHDARINPDDVYDLAPVAFADLGPTVHERGLEWGAAKAHVHLRRRREDSR